MTPLMLLKSAGALAAQTTISSWPQYPTLTFMSAAALLSVITTVVALKVFKSYNLGPEICKKIKVFEFQKRHPLAPLLGMTFCVTVSMISLPLGVITVIPMGMYIGLQIERRLSLRSQKIHAAGNPRMAPNNHIAKR
jgi:hypothetical protein